MLKLGRNEIIFVGYTTIIIIAAIILYSYKNIGNYKNSFQLNLQTIAEIIIRETQESIVSGDFERTEDILKRAGLKAKSATVCIYDLKDNLVVSYKSVKGYSCPASLTRQMIIASGFNEFYSNIMDWNGKIASIYIISNNIDLKSTLLQNAEVASYAFVLLAILIYLASIRYRKYQILRLHSQSRIDAMTMHDRRKKLLAAFHSLSQVAENMNSTGKLSNSLTHELLDVTPLGTSKVKVTFSLPKKLWQEVQKNQNTNKKVS